MRFAFESFPCINFRRNINTDLRCLFQEEKTGNPRAHWRENMCAGRRHPRYSGARAGGTSGSLLLPPSPHCSLEIALLIGALFMLST